MTQYSETDYVSLGYNCETAFQVERRFGSGHRSFFSWGIFSIDAVLSLIRTRFNYILNPDNLVWDMVNELPMDIAHGYSFHGPWKSGAPSSDPEFLAKLHAHHQKSNYLARKFLDAERPRVYFYKQREPTSPIHLLALADALQTISAESTLVLLHSKDQALTAAEHPILCHRVLSRYAPESDARDADSSSWDAIFDEFS